MRTKHIEVFPYTARWKQDFENIKQELIAVLGDLAITIEHVGSTSVEGLAAKPIIDIDVVVANKNTRSAIQALSSIGYIHEGDLGIAGREAFRYEGKEHLQTHHLYVCPEDSPELRRHLLFRDYLKEHHELAEEYGKVKTEAAKLFPDDIEGYIEYKSPIIHRIYQEIGLS